jgi:hypothetical protein
MRCLKWGIQQSEKENVALGLVAAPVACTLYEKAGFKDIEICTVMHISDRAMVKWPKQAK